MRSFKNLFLLPLFISHFGFSQENGIETLVNLEKAKQIAEKLKNEPGFQDPTKTIHDTNWVHDNQQKIKQMVNDAQKTLPEFYEEAVKEKTEQFSAEAQALVQNAMEGSKAVLQEKMGISQKEASEMTGTMGTEKTEHFAIFISFSLSDAEIKDALATAAKHGAKVYLYGMKKGDASITDTMKTVQRLGAKLTNPPETRFNPKAFEEFGVTQVPTIIYQENGKTYLAKGITNLQWLRGKSIDEIEVGDLGVFGPTKPVVEESIVETLKRRLANYDWDSQKKKTVDTFWKKQAFLALPAATEQKVWFINPTVRVQNDVVNPRGVVLARAGDVINPLNTPMGRQGYIVFDANDQEQVDWAHKYSTEARKSYPVMLMTSQLSKADGWKHLASLREKFKSEIYIVPNELINRFNLTALPVSIVPDMQKRVLKVEQFVMVKE